MSHSVSDDRIKPAAGEHHATFLCLPEHWRDWLEHRERDTMFDTTRFPLLRQVVPERAILPRLAVWRLSNGSWRADAVETARKIRPRCIPEIQGAVC